MKLLLANRVFLLGKQYSILLLLSIILFSCHKNNPENNYTVVFYNVENLFDTIDHPGFADEEFTPSGKKHWDDNKYRKKLNDIAFVLTSINKQDSPELIGLCEVENQTVLEDLLHTNSMSKWGYDIVHEESPDFRGIDVALLYRKDEFKLIDYKVLPVIFQDEPGYKTRDILSVTGKIKDDTIHVFVNHWPSRIGGKEKTEKNRVHVASVLRNEVDRILGEDKDANIIIMGDMNDEPTDISIFEMLGAKSTENESRLYNLMLKDKQAGLGTYNYRGSWNMLDNLIVSERILKGGIFQICSSKGFIFSNDSMVYITKDSLRVPNRTYLGNRYVAGISDHFPVYFKFRLN